MHLIGLLLAVAVVLHMLVVLVKDHLVMVVVQVVPMQVLVTGDMELLLQPNLLQH